MYFMTTEEKNRQIEGIAMILVGYCRLYDISVEDMLSYLKTELKLRSKCKDLKDYVTKEE